MARPRTPSNILELRGAFKNHPERRRKDLDGAGPFDPHPPATLPQELVSAWNEVVQQVNPAVLTASDSTSVEIMARLLLITASCAKGTAATGEIFTDALLAFGLLLELAAAKLQDLQQAA